MNAFVTGTDTGVGKTYVTARLIRHLRARGFDTVGFKPICCGSREDAEILRAAADDALSAQRGQPRLAAHARPRPYTAALIENRAIDLALVHETFAFAAGAASIGPSWSRGWAAGWCPSTRTYAVADLAREMGLPVVVVVRNRLGALNHTALTVHHMRAERSCRAPG